MQHKKTELFNAIEEFIDEYVDLNGSSPTVRDIADGVGVSNPTVCKYLAAMKEQGIIEYDDHRKPVTRQMMNDIRNTTRTPFRAGFAPVVVSIACGSPGEREEYIEEIVSLPKSLFGEGPLFILRATGESMIEAGIEDGDLVVVSGLVCSCFCSCNCKHEFAAMLQLSETLELISKNYGEEYERTGYFAAINKATLFVFAVDGKETGSITL